MSKITYDIQQDNDAQSPREWDNLSTMVFWHRNYSIGDINPNRENDPESWLRSWLVENGHLTEEGAERMTFEKLWNKFNSVAVVVSVYAYEHGGITISSRAYSCTFDSGQLGFAFVSYAKLREEYSRRNITHAFAEKIRGYIDGEIKTLDAYLTGDVWGYVVERDGEQVDSCWGIFDYDEAVKEAKASVAYFEKEEIVKADVSQDAIAYAQMEMII